MIEESLSHYTYYYKWNREQKKYEVYPKEAPWVKGWGTSFEDALEGAKQALRDNFAGRIICPARRDEDDV